MFYLTLYYDGSTCNHNYLYRWLPCQYFTLLMMGAWRPKHVEKVCSNKIYILLHHVGVLFNLILWCKETKLKSEKIWIPCSYPVWVYGHVTLWWCRPCNQLIPHPGNSNIFLNKHLSGQQIEHGQSQIPSLIHILDISTVTFYTSPGRSKQRPNSTLR